MGTRADDLIANIRESYRLVRAYEKKCRLETDPIERERCLTRIEEQKELIAGWAQELVALGVPIPDDVAQIIDGLGSATPPPGPDAIPMSTFPDREPNPPPPWWRRASPRVIAIIAICIVIVAAVAIFFLPRWLGNGATPTPIPTEMPIPQPTATPPVTPPSTATAPPTPTPDTIPVEFVLKCTKFETAGQGFLLPVIPCDIPQRPAAVRFSWDVSVERSFAGCTINLPPAFAATAPSHTHLVFWARGDQGTEQFQVELLDLDGNKSKETVKLASQDGQKVSIPLANFARGGVNLERLDKLSLAFDYYLGASSRNSSLCIDEIGFESP